MQLKPADLEKLTGDGGTLSDKFALNLTKYVFKAFELVVMKDAKTLALCTNGQHLLKVQLKIKEQMGNASILKAQFEKN